MKTANQGFTLIELVMVIVILGILAAAAIPKIIDLSTEARVSSVKAMAGAVSTGAMLARSKAIISGADVSLPADGTPDVDINDDGTSDDLQYGYPQVSDDVLMQWIIEDLGEFTYDSSSGRYVLLPNCYVEYQNATGPNSGPSITTEISGC